MLALSPMHRGMQERIGRGKMRKLVCWDKNYLQSERKKEEKTKKWHKGNYSLPPTSRLILDQNLSNSYLRRQTLSTLFFFLNCWVWCYTSWVTCYLSGRGQSEKQRKHWCCLSTVPNINNTDLIIINDDKTLMIKHNITWLASNKVNFVHPSKTQYSLKSVFS